MRYQLNRVCGPRHQVGCNLAKGRIESCEGGGRVDRLDRHRDLKNARADHLAALPDKLVRRYEVPFADGAGTVWHFIEEFDTTEPVIAGLPENYIEQIVTAYATSGAGHRGQIGLAPSLLVDARPMLAFAIGWLEARATSA